MASGNYGNKLLDAMSIVAEGKVRSYHYDETIEAVIKDASQAKEGKYRVEYTGGTFEAYGNDLYHEKETVYVTVPKGDFTKQKFIIGRKIDEENAPGTTFNFRMPFDDFIALRNLTNQVDPIKTKNGGAKFLANHPEHGTEVESSNGYTAALIAAQNTLSNITTSWANKMITFQTNCEKLKEEFDNVNYIIETVEVTSTSYDSAGRMITTITPKEERNQKHIQTGESMGSSSYLYNDKTYRQAIVDVINQYAVITGNWSTSATAYTTAWNSIKTILLHYLRNVICADTTTYPTRTYDALIPNFAWDDSDLNVFLSTIESNYGMGHASQENTYLTEYSAKVQEQGQIIDDLARNNSNNNLLWSWSDTSGQVLMETKLGVSIDITTLLGDYQPIDGKYGIRMVLTGTTKPTEDEMSKEIIETVYFTNESMYGNTYGYYSPYTQQKIFDLSGFLTLTHIDIYFWQDHENHIFRDYNGNPIPYTRTITEGTNTRTVNLPENIVVANLQVLMGLTADEATEDRVIIYSYDDKNYGITEADLDNPTAVQWQKDNAKKDIKIAWIHIDPADGKPVLVDHEIQSNAYDVNSLEYWHAKIYWYNYQYGHPLNNGVEAEKYGGVNWKPKPFNNKNQTAEFVYSEDKANFHCEVIPSPDKSKEKYKAVILANNTPYRSDILEFINLDTTVADSDFDGLYQVVFRFLKGVPSNDGTQMNIVQDDSIGNFFVYDENNNVIVNDDGVQYSQIPYYVQIWVRNNETGDYSPASLDPDNGISEVTWIPFGNNSMVTSFMEPSESEMENTELTPIKGSMTDDQKRLIKLITRKFYINNRWVMNYSDNMIRATVRRGKKNKLYSVQKELLFGQSGTMGSPYTVVIQQTEPENGEMVVGGKFTLTARIFERGQERPNSKYKFKWKLLGLTYVTPANNTPLSPDGFSPNLDKLDYSGNISDEQLGAWWNSSWTTTNAGGYQGNRISGYIRNNMPLIIKVEVKDCADYEISTIVGFALVNTPKISGKSVLFEKNLVAQCPDRVEFKSDGSAPIADLMKFSVVKKRVAQQNQTAANCGYLFQDKYQDEDDNLYPQEIYPEWELYCYQQNDIRYNTQVDPNTGKTVRTGIKDITYVGEKNPIDGTPSLLACLSLKKEVVYPTTITGQSDLPDSQVEGHNLYSLSTSNNYASENSYGPNGPANWYWEDAYETDYYVVLQWKKLITVTNIVNNQKVTESATFWFRQAVPLVLNTYSSSLVNTWNGELLIDYENNAIMSKMMAAGSKNSQNQFTGVMMGDWANKGDTSLDIPGMYGFAAGRQVFGLRTNGTGFIGKSGKGQIQFDGNYALISNADKTCYINLDPIRYEQLDDGIRLRNNYQGYSQYFLYAESDATTPTDGTNTAEFLWANKILGTTNKDIFAVDPNNGIITTGGIFAKYGRIGKYLLLNDSGLTYKQHYNPTTGIVDIINDDLTSSENIDIMFIGQERRRDGSLIPLNNTGIAKRKYDHYYWSSDSYKAGAGSTLSGWEQSEGNSGAGKTIVDDGEVLGRYVIWASDKKPGRGSFPNFGVEHDGTVHLTNAYVQGVIHASTLVIGDEDYQETIRTQGGPKTYYTDLGSSNSNLRGCNPALIHVDSDSELNSVPSAKRFLYSKKGACHSQYGDWLRPGDTWYIRSNTVKQHRVFTGGATALNPDTSNPYRLQTTNITLKKYSITFKNGSNFEYKTINNKKCIVYTGGLTYFEYSYSSNQETKTERTLSDELNITNLEATLKDLNKEIKNYKYTDSSSGTSQSVTKWEENYHAKHEAYLEAKQTYGITDSYTTTALTAYKNALKIFRKAQNGLQTKQAAFKTAASKYDGVYGGLEAWAETTNSTNNTPLDKTAYNASTLLIDKLDNQEVTVIDAENQTIKCPNANALQNLTDEDLTTMIDAGTSMSYTQLVWEGAQSSTNNHEWYGTWTNSNSRPTGASVGSKITENQLVDCTNQQLEIIVETPTDFASYDNATRGCVHPQLITKKQVDSNYHKLHRFSAPPGWRIIGDVDSGSIWDALSHATLTFHQTLQNTTGWLTKNLQDTIDQLATALGGDREAALEALRQQRQELVTMLTTVQKEVLDTVYQSASDIRNGMDPISFFDDGNCYVFLSKTPIATQIEGIGMVPAGLTIAQTASSANDNHASVFYLNSKRMGFYRSVGATLGGQDITINIPLLAYYNGSMGLAGSLFFGLDYENFIASQDLRADILNEDGTLKDTTVMAATTESFGVENGRTTLYKNYLDGPNARIILANGAIVIDALDNGRNVDGQDCVALNKVPYPNAMQKGKQEGGLPYIHVGTTKAAKGVIRIGRHGSGAGYLSIADFDFASCSYNLSFNTKTVDTTAQETKAIIIKYSEMSSIGAVSSTTANAYSIQIPNIDNISSDGGNPPKYSVTYGNPKTITYNFKKLTKRSDITHSKPTKHNETENIGYQIIKMVQQTKSVSGDILTIVQKTTENTKYSGIGIIANDAESEDNARIILGPIRAKTLPTSDNVLNDIIDTVGYDSSGTIPDAWLTGWNFYGNKIFAKNITTQGQVIVGGKLYVRNESISTETFEYAEVADKYWTLTQLSSLNDTLCTAITNNITTISTSFDNLKDVVNDHSVSIDALAEGLSNTASGLQGAVGGVNNALGSAAAALTTARAALSEAAEALAKAQQALKKTVANGWLLSNTYTNDTIPGTTNITLTLMLDPEWSGSNPYSPDRPHLKFIATSAAADYLHRHGFLVKTSGSATNGSYSECTLEIGRVRDYNLDIGGGTGASPGVASINISGDLEWVADSYDNNRLTSLRSVLNIGDKSIVLGKISTYAKLMQLDDWHALGGYSSWNNVTVNLGTGDSGEKQIQLKLPWRNDSNNTLLINLYTALNSWTYSKEKIDEKVQTAFKKGWNDGWDADYLETKTKTGGWYVKLRRPAYNGPGADKLTIAEKKGNVTHDQHLNFEFQLADNEIQVWMTNDGEIGDHSSNPLATEYVYFHYNSSSGYNADDKTYSYTISNKTRSGTSGEHIYVSGTLNASAAYEAGWHDAYERVSIERDKIEYPAQYSYWDTWSNTTDTYNAGWSAAAGKFYRSGNTVYGPSTTVGESEHYSVSHTGYSKGAAHWSTSSSVDWDWSYTNWGYNYRNIYLPSSRHEGWYYQVNNGTVDWDNGIYLYGTDNNHKRDTETIYTYIADASKGTLTWTDSE